MHSIYIIFFLIFITKYSIYMHSKLFFPCNLCKLSNFIQTSRSFFLFSMHFKLLYLLCISSVFYFVCISGYFITVFLSLCLLNLYFFKPIILISFWFLSILLLCFIQILINTKYCYLVYIQSFAFRKYNINFSF